MAFAKRIVLFLLTNILIVLTLSFILQFLGIGHYVRAYGLDYQSLMIFCFVWGMGGAFISLLLSKVMAKWMMGVKVIDPRNQGQFRELFSIVEGLSRRAGISMPEVGVFESPELNAFATGPTKNHSLVAVSSGLLNKMNSDQVEAVLGHEITHVANGDMVTLTLIQGIINAFVMFLARVIAFFMTQSRDRESSSSMSRFFITMVLEMVLGLFGAMLVAWFSRFREFRADMGGAKLAGKRKMISALEKLKETYSLRDPRIQQDAFQSMKISGSRKGFLSLFATHPPLEDRIAALERAPIV